jgi:hypothetical protein
MMGSVPGRETGAERGVGFWIVGRWDMIFSCWSDVHIEGAFHDNGRTLVEFDINVKRKALKGQVFSLSKCFRPGLGELVPNFVHVI